MSLENVILNIFSELHQGLEVAEERIQSGLQAIADAAPHITATLQTVTEVAGVVGSVVSLPTAAASALAIASEATAGLNAFAQSLSGGGLVNDIASLANGFVAYQTAKSATANASLNVAAHAQTVLTQGAAQPQKGK